MTISHRPTDATLAAFAAGTLDEGRALVVATHLAMSAESRKIVQTFESVGGAMLEDAQPVALSAGALQRTLDKLSIDRPAIVARMKAAAADLPAALAGYEITAWRWLGPGIVCRHII